MHKILLRVAGALLLLTSLGHTAGTFMTIPAEQTEVVKTAAVMKATLVPMPVGKAQNYSDLFLGNNIAVSLFLLLLGINFFALSGADARNRSLLVLNSLAACGFAVISARFFFPIPAVLTGVAGIMGLLVAARKRP